MELRKVSDGVIVTVFVKPKSNRFQLKVEGNELTALCRESPVKGKVNRELIKELSRIFKSKVEVVAGLASRQKKVLIRDLSIDEANSVLSKTLAQ